MPLNLLMCSLIVRRSAIDQRYPGGWDGFLASHGENPTLKHDAELVRFEAMGDYFGKIIADLERHDILLHRADRPGDVARDPLETVPWLDVGMLEMRQGYHAIVCRLRGSQDTSVELPEGFGDEVLPGAKWVPWTGPDWELVHSEPYLQVYVDRLTGLESVECDQAAWAKETAPWVPVCGSSDVDDSVIRGVWIALAAAGRREVAHAVRIAPRGSKEASFAALAIAERAEGLGAGSRRLLLLARALLKGDLSKARTFDHLVGFMRGNQPGTPQVEPP